MRFTLLSLTTASVIMGVLSAAHGQKKEQSAVFCAAFSTLPQMTGSSLTVSWLILSEATI